MILNCKPIKSEPPDGDCENILVSDEKGYPWVVVFMDAFYDKDDTRIYDKIRSGKNFQLRINLVE